MSILKQAEEIIYGDREKTYGHPAKNLAVIAQMWQVYLGAINWNGERKLTPDDICSMMALLKLARLANTPEHKDSQVDICGYIALMERCQEFSQKENTLSTDNHFIKTGDRFKAGGVIPVSCQKSGLLKLDCRYPNCDCAKL